MIIKERGLWMGCAAAGVATLITAILIMPYFPTEAAVGITGYGSPVIAFEFARSPADLAAVFGGDADPERAGRIAMMDQGNRGDFLFMTVYSIFGALFGFAVRGQNAALGSVILVAAIIAGLMDAVETWTLLSITSQMNDGIATPAGLALLGMPVTTKFVALAISIVGAGLFLVSRVGFVWTTLGGLTILMALLCVPALFIPDRFGSLLTLSIGIGWIVMLAYAATRSARGVTLAR